ncbi:MAG TPA: Eco57I restriction-modification methylase domain-containing protein [Solirubrobacterales bacterium]|nr:Eco57I restriction-modification methylase domain-containing protein [Solirubrobacterales bacterium]
MPVQERQHIPDILECLAQLSSDEVPTPPKLANAMLDLLPDEVWTNPNYRWCDPCSKSGVFLREIAKRLLFEGLVEWEPNFEKRREHIFRNMIFGCGITELTGIVSRRTVYYSRHAAGEHSVIRMDSDDGNIPFVRTEHEFKSGRCMICGAPEDLERGPDRENYAYAFIHEAYPTEEMGDMKFDVIVGNPPYQIDSAGNTRTKPIYQLFVEKAVAMDPRYVLMITPSRWFAGGLGLEGYRQSMLGSRKIRALVDYVDPTDCFPGVDIQAGVSYFLWDREYSGPATVRAGKRDGVSEGVLRSLDEFDIFIRDNNAVQIIRRVRDHGEATVSQRALSTLPFGLRSNYSSKNKSPADPIRVFGRDRSEIVVDRSEIKLNAEEIDRFKVLVPRAYGERGHGPYFALGKPFVAEPGTASTMTYAVLGCFDARAEAERFEAYVRSRFFRFLVLQRKVTQDLVAERFAFVPDLPMDRDWTDADLYGRYGLTNDEIAFVESQVKEMPAPETAAA